jgi:metal-responsive CopG/Arc/MetJ family transcriptional regulator
VPLKSNALALRLQVTLPALIMRRIDAQIEQWGQTRSSFLAEAARHELENLRRGRSMRVARKPISRAAKRKQTTAEIEARERTVQGRRGTNQTAPKGRAGTLQRNF